MRLGCSRTAGCRTRVHAEVDRLQKEKLKGKKKKKRNPARLLRDDLRAEQHRAAAEELVARLEVELVERAGEEDEDYEKTDWRGVGQFDLDDSDGEPLYEDPRQHAWFGCRRTCGRCRRTRRWRHCGLWCELRQGRS